MKENTLVIALDDDPDFNNWMKSFFKVRDTAFEAHTDVRSFVEAIKAKPPSVCLIDLNLDLSQGEGLQMIKALRSKFSTSLPIIVISKRSSSEDIVQALEAGANDFIPKPVDKVTLEAKLKRYLEAKASKELPYFSVTESLRACEINLHFQLARVSEMELEFLGPHLVTKHTWLKLQSPMIHEITGRPSYEARVHRNGLVENTGSYFFTVEFDPMDKELAMSVRTWLARKLPG